MKRIVLFTIICAFLSCKGQIESKTATSSFEFLSEEALKAKNKEDLRLLRNEIFARKGYVFKSDDLNTYFKTKTWYTPDATVKVILSDEEQNYIDKIKALESLTKKTDKCLDYFNDNVKTIYPLKGYNDNWPTSDFFKIYYEQNKDRIHDIVFEQVSFCDGFYFYNINCNTDIENILFTAYCNDDPIFHILSIKGNEIIKKVKVVDSSLRTSDNDSVMSGYHDINFKLDRDNLEVYKIFKIWDEENSTEENRYPVKEVRRELISKYKLTENGIVEL